MPIAPAPAPAPIKTYSGPQLQLQPAAPVSGSYLISITGLHVGQMSFDDQLSRDGRGDEIYAAAYVRRYNRKTGQVLEEGRVFTQGYGDITGWGGNTRKLAGSMSSVGGIQNFDSIPLGFPAGPRPANIYPLPSNFPMLVWQGTLTDGADVLAISPSIWESDNDQTQFVNWIANQGSVTQALIADQKLQDQMARNGFVPILLDPMETASQTLLELYGKVLLTAFIGGMGFPGVGLLYDSPYDRPVGIAPGPGGTTVLPNTVVVLTREAIELALRTPALGVIQTSTPGMFINLPKPGMMVISFIDTVTPSTLEKPAAYYMILQVEPYP